MHVHLGWLLLLFENYVHFVLKFLPSLDPIDLIFYRSQIHLTPHFAVRSDPIGSIFSARAGHPRQKFSQVPPPGTQYCTISVMHSLHPPSNIQPIDHIYSMVWLQDCR